MEKRLRFIDALRGYAILGVIIVHVSQKVELGAFFKLILTQGQMGVQLFFIMSAYTMFFTLDYRKGKEKNG